MSVSDLHSKFTFNSAHWLCILQQDHHHHVRSSFFSWWSISFIKPTAAKSHSCVSCTLSSCWDFLNLNVNDAFSFFFFLFACHQQQTCSSATNLSGCALRGLVMMSYFCGSWMSEEQLCVFVNFFLGKEMIRVQINYSDEISRSTVINH